jgi:hypothetical protein
MAITLAVAKLEGAGALVPRDTIGTLGDHNPGDAQKPRGHHFI